MKYLRSMCLISWSFPVFTKKTAKALQREDRRHEATSGLDAQGQGSYINESQLLPAHQFLAKLGKDNSHHSHSCPT